jgi:hypothetical protein
MKEKQTAIIGCIIVGIGSVLFFWGILLNMEMFVPTRIWLLSVIIGGLVGTILLSRIWKKENYGHWTVLLFFGIMAGASVPFFSIAAINYYGKSDITEKRTLKIMETGNSTKSKSKCATPYAVVKIDEIKGELYFPCDYEHIMNWYKHVDVTLSKGYLGYYVVIDSQLIGSSE